MTMLYTSYRILLYNISCKAIKSMMFYYWITPSSIIIDVIYPEELEIKDTTDAPKWANCLDLHLEFDEDGNINFAHDYDNVPCLSSNIPESPAYGIFVSQLIRYARVCSKYKDFLFNNSILISKLLKQGYYSRKLQTTFRSSYRTCSQIWHLCVIYMYIEGVVHQLVSSYSSESWRCHMWGRKFSLFPEHLILFPLKVSQLNSYNVRFGWYLW